MDEKSTGKDLQAVRQDLLEHATCLDCDYSLRGLLDCKCPECGRSFDPYNALTLGPKKRGFIFKRFGKPPQRWHRWSITAITLFWIIDLSSPGLFFNNGTFGLCFHVFLVFFFLMILADWFVKALVVGGYLVAGERIDSGRPRCWLITLLCPAVLIFSAWTMWPLKARFALSKSALEDAVATKRMVGGWTRIGAFYVDGILRTKEGGVFFITANDPVVWGRDGILFVPGEMPTRPLRGYRQLAPRWYIATDTLPD